MAAATRQVKRPLRSKPAIALRVGKVLGRFKTGKHFYVMRTSVKAEVLSSQDTVRWYKGLAVVKRAFRSLKSVDLKVRPIYHRVADRVRAHVFLCLLAYYVEWRRDLLHQTALEAVAVATIRSALTRAGEKDSIERDGVRRLAAQPLAELVKLGRQTVARVWACLLRAACRRLISRSPFAPFHASTRAIAHARVAAHAYWQGSPRTGPYPLCNASVWLM